MSINSRYLLLLLIIVLFIGFSTNANAQVGPREIPEGFVYAKEIMPSLRTDLRYYSSNNFVGNPIDGYTKPKCILTKEAAEALKNVQDEVQLLIDQDDINGKLKKSLNTVLKKLDKRLVIFLKKIGNDINEQKN